MYMGMEESQCRFCSMCRRTFLLENSIRLILLPWGYNLSQLFISSWYKLAAPCEREGEGGGRLGRGNLRGTKFIVQRHSWPVTGKSGVRGALN